FEEAEQFFDQAMNVLQKVHDKSLRARLTANINYDRSANSYRKGDIMAARAGFRKVEQSANALGWQRAASDAQNYLADIAIQEGNYEEAEGRLGPGLTMVERNNDRRRTASYKRSYARLKRKQGKLSEALDWARQAREGYERLGAK